MFSASALINISILDVGEEIKLATVKQTANGFTNGEMYFGTGVNGVVGKLSANGTVSNLTWSVLSTNGDNQTLLRGSLYVDQTGVFSNNLIVVTGAGETEGGGVWRINSSGQGTQLVNITNTHLEGLITLPNDVVKWGPWAGKIVCGAESHSPPLIYTIATNGATASFALGIAPEDFDIIPANQNLYICDFDQNKILKLPAAYFANHVGDLLITEAGEFGSSPKLFIVHWNGTSFITTSLSYNGIFEHVTFAPLNLPALP